MPDDPAEVEYLPYSGVELAGDQKSAALRESLEAAGSEGRL